VNIDRASIGIRAFMLSATDVAGVAIDVSTDVVEVSIKPLGVRPAPADWIVCVWDQVLPDLVQVKFNMPGGFPIAGWNPGTYWWFAKPHDIPEVPVLHGPDYIEIS
jgi:hypothetical protein